MSSEENDERGVTRMSFMKASAGVAAGMAAAGVPAAVAMADEGREVPTKPHSRNPVVAVVDGDDVTLHEGLGQRTLRHARLAREIKKAAKGSR